MQSRCNLPSRKGSTMWTIRRFTTTTTKARMLPTAKDPPAGLNLGHLSIIRRMGMESMDNTHVKEKSTTRMDGQTHLITMKRTRTCGDDTKGTFGWYLLALMHIGWSYRYLSHYIRIGVWFTVCSVCVSGERMFMVVGSIASGGLAMHVSSLRGSLSHGFWGS